MERELAEMGALIHRGSLYVAKWEGYKQDTIEERSRDRTPMEKHQIKVLAAAFEMIDTDGSRGVDKQELCAWLNELDRATALERARVDMMFQQLDGNSDGNIDLEEWLDLLTAPQREMICVRFARMHTLWISVAAALVVAASTANELRPGEYLTTAPLTTITETEELDSNDIADLQKGTRILVLDVVQQNYTQRIRGRVHVEAGWQKPGTENPEEGWVSLKNLETGFRWVGPVDCVDGAGEVPEELPAGCQCPGPEEVHSPPEEVPDEVAECDATVTAVPEVRACQPKRGPAAARQRTKPTANISPPRRRNRVTQ